MWIGCLSEPKRYPRDRMAWRRSVMWQEWNISDQALPHYHTYVSKYKEVVLGRLAMFCCYAASVSAEEASRQVCSFSGHVNHGGLTCAQLVSENDGLPHVAVVPR
jgi:hypothetical protein